LTNCTSGASGCEGKAVKEVQLIRRIPKTKGSTPKNGFIIKNHTSIQRAKRFNRNKDQQQGYWEYQAQTLKDTASLAILRNFDIQSPRPSTSNVDTTISTPPTPPSSIKIR
jgi:hypothetical protein